MGQMAQLCQGLRTKGFRHAVRMDIELCHEGDAVLLHGVYLAQMGLVIHDHASLEGLPNQVDPACGNLVVLSQVNGIFLERHTFAVSVLEMYLAAGYSGRDLASGSGEV